MKMSSGVEQLCLIAWANPLSDRVGRSFFLELPATPGVYQFLSRNAEVLYVGQSKNLRERVGSYRFVRESRSSRKLVRLVSQTWAIRIEETDTPLQAQLRENALIRQYRPKYNAANTHPESHVFLGLRTRGTMVETRWTRSPVVVDGWEPGIEVHGAFSSWFLDGWLGPVRRLLHWHANHAAEVGSFPYGLFGPKLAPVMCQNLGPGAESLRLVRRLRAMLKHGDCSFVHRIAGKGGECLHHAGCPFLRSVLSRDAAMLEEYASSSLVRRRNLKRSSKVHAAGHIPQAEFDDLMVRMRGSR